MTWEKEVTMKTLNLRRITSLSILFIGIWITYTGVVLYFAPPGRVAYWSNWHFLGLDKVQYQAQHTLFSYLFVGLGVLHTVYNWKPLVNYLKSRGRVALRSQGNLLVALLLTAGVGLGTHFEGTPFREVMTLGEYLSGLWEADSGNAPYSHAEQDSLATLSERLRLDPEAVRHALIAGNLNPGAAESTLKDIAAANGTSPQALFALIAPLRQQKLEAATLAGSSAADKDKTRTLTAEVDPELVFGAGLGKKTLADLAPKANLSTEQALAVLALRGIQARSDQNLRAISEPVGLQPGEVAALLLVRQ